MLALLIGLLVGAGPLLRGAWDPWAQSLLFCVVALGGGLWLAGRVLIGYVPTPSPRAAVWALALAALAAASAAASPVSALAVPSWRALALGLWIFPAVTLVSKDERGLIDEAVRAAAWTLALLAFYQRFHDHNLRPTSALLNENAFAGSILLFLPLAVAKSDWLLSFLLFVCLCWSRSVGAWLGLAAALMLLRRSTGQAGLWLGAFIAACGLVAIWGKLQSADVAHRWSWWLAAARMARARPWLGFGPGAFAYALPAYQDPRATWSSVFAHEHLLEVAAECGLPFLLFWLAGLSAALGRGGAHKRFGAIALLVQSLWDYGLSIPANLWLFCYFAASSSPERARGLNVSARAKLPLAAASLGAALVLSGWSWRLWQADRLKGSAAESLAAGGDGREAAALLARSARLSPDPETERLAAQAELRRLGETREGLLAAAGHLARAARLNPYRASSWLALARLSRRLGDDESARRFLAEGARTCPSLRGPSP